MGVLVAPALVLGMLLAALAPAAEAATAQITNVRLTALTTTTATVAWDTDIPSDTQVVYGATTAYGSTTTLNTTKVTGHASNITGLAANRTYHYQVRSRDAAGDLATSSDRILLTPLGSTTVGTSVDSDNANTINLTRFTTVTGGAVVSMSAYVGAVDPSVARRSFQLAIYTANASAPGTLVASSATGTLVANSWNTVSISATLAPSTSYYFGYNTNGASSGVNNLRYSSSGSSGWKTGGQAFGTWPSSLGAFTNQSATFSHLCLVRQRHHASHGLRDRAHGRHDCVRRDHARSERHGRLRLSRQYSSRSVGPTSGLLTRARPTRSAGTPRPC